MAQNSLQEGNVSRGTWFGGDLQKYPSSTEHDILTLTYKRLHELCTERGMNIKKINDEWTGTRKLPSFSSTGMVQAPKLEVLHWYSARHYIEADVTVESDLAVRVFGKRRLTIAFSIQPTVLAFPAQKPVHSHAARHPNTFLAYIYMFICIWALCKKCTRLDWVLTRCQHC